MLTPLLIFLLFKLIAYTLLGLMLGFLGSFVTLSPILRGYFQIFIAVYLLGVAGALLNLHPFFRYFLIKPPKFILRLARKESHSSSFFAPAILGTLTVFLPCATTQAMIALALATANPLYAATIMFAFVLGTSPTFALLGFLFTHSQRYLNRFFYPLTAALMVFLALFSLNSGLTLTGSPYTYSNFATVLGVHHDIISEAAGTNLQQITIKVTNNGYAPNIINLKAGVKTRLNLITDHTYSCARAFVIPSLNYQVVLPNTGSTIYEFTPTTVGAITFSCSMGMYTGQFKVI